MWSDDICRDFDPCCLDIRKCRNLSRTRSPCPLNTRHNIISKICLQSNIFCSCILCNRTFPISFPVNHFHLMISYHDIACCHWSAKFFRYLIEKKKDDNLIQVYYSNILRKRDKLIESNLLPSIPWCRTQYKLFQKGNSDLECNKNFHGYYC